MSEPTTPGETGAAEARITVTGADEIVAKAVEQETARNQSLDLDAIPETSGESDSSTDEGEPEKGKPPKGVQKRLDELTREKYDQQRRADALEAQLQELMRGQNPGPNPNTQSFDGAPDPDQYPDGELDVNFIRDLTRWEVRQEIQAAKNEAVHFQTVKQIEDRETAAREKYPDYAEKVSHETLGPLQYVHPEVFRDMAAHEVGPDLAYYLGNNPQEVVAMTQMSPMMAAMRMGQLIAALSPGLEHSPLASKPLSKAPPPINPIRGNGASPAVNYEAKLAEAEASGNYDLWRKLKAASQKGK